MEEYIESLTKFTKITIVAAVVLIFYGFIARHTSTYFFWESKTIGFALLMIGLISLLTDDISIKKKAKKDTVIQKVGVGLIIFILFVRILFVIIIPQTDAYEVAKNYIKQSETIKNQLGEVKGFGLIPLGGIQKSSDANGVKGSASLKIIIKGERKFKEVSVEVIKKANSDWKVETIK